MNWMDIRKPRYTPPYTLFGSGQHYGSTECESCGRPIKRNSGMQRFCGSATTKGSCGYKYTLYMKKIQYKNRLLNVPKIKYIKKKEALIPSPILECLCGRRYIKTRLGQEKCLACSVNNLCYS